MKFRENFCRCEEIVLDDVCWVESENAGMIVAVHVLEQLLSHNVEVMLFVNAEFFKVDIDLELSLCQRRALTKLWKTNRFKFSFNYVSDNAFDEVFFDHVYSYVRSILKNAFLL